MSWFSGTDADDWSASGATNELNTDLFKEVHSSKVGILNPLTNGQCYHPSHRQGVLVNSVLF